MNRASYDLTRLRRNGDPVPTGEKDEHYDHNTAREPIKFGDRVTYDVPAVDPGHRPGGLARDHQVVESELVTRPVTLSPKLRRACTLRLDRFSGLAGEIHT